MGGAPAGQDLAGRQAQRQVDAAAPQLRAVVEAIGVMVVGHHAEDKKKAKFDRFYDDEAKLKAAFSRAGTSPAGLNSSLNILIGHAYDAFRQAPDQAKAEEQMGRVVAAVRALSDAVPGLQIRPPMMPAQRPQQPSIPRDPQREATYAAAAKERLAQQLKDRDRRKREADEFYAHPEYQRDKAGVHDSQLDPDYLARRRRLFGKRVRGHLVAMS